MGFLDNLKSANPAPQSTPSQTPPAPGPQRTANPYAGMGAQELSKKRNYLLKGRHVLKVIQCGDGHLPEQIGGQFFFGVDFEVVESTNADMVPGSERSWMTRLGKFKEYFFKDVKGFIAAAAKVDPAQVGDKAGSEAASQQNPLAGFLVLADTVETNKVNPDTGEKYVNTRFSILPQ